MRCVNHPCKGTMRPTKWLYRELGTEDGVQFLEYTYWIPVGPRRYKEVQPMMCDKCGDIKGRYTGKVRELTDA